MPFTRLTEDLNIISKLADEPNDVGGLTAAELKAEFDKAGNAVKDWINTVLLPSLEGEGGAGSLGVRAISSLTGAGTVQAALEKLVAQMQEITQGAVANGSINAEKLAPGAVETEKLAAQAVTGEKLAPGAVTGEKLANGALSAEKYAAGSVGTAALADGNVTTAKLANKSVSTAKLGDKAVGTEQLDDLSVTTGKLFTLAVTAEKLANGSVATAKLADGAVTLGKLAAEVKTSIDGKAPLYSYGTSDLTAGSSALTTGKLHIVYE